MSNSRSRRLGLYTVRLLAMGGLLWYLFTSYDFSGLQNFITRKWFLWFPFIIGVQVLVRWIESYQVFILLKTHGIRQSVVNVFRCKLTSAFYTLIVPGEVASSGISWYLLSRGHHKGFEVLTSLTYVRIVNMLILLIASCLTLLWDASEFSRVLTGPLLGTILVLILVLIPFSVRQFRTGFAHVMDRFTKRLRWPILTGLAGRFLAASEEAGHVGPQMICRQISLAFLTVCLNAAMMTICFFLAGINAPWNSTIWIQGLLLVVAILPISLASIGVREITLITILGFAYQISPENALILSLMLLTVSLIINGGIGGLVHVRVDRGLATETMSSQLSRGR